MAREQRMEALAVYEGHLREARGTFARRWETLGITASTREPAWYERFMINFCSLGVSMTEPVESWIYRAGARCLEIGLEELGRRLQAHARHEAGHHELMIRDTRALVENWNRHHAEQLDADGLLARPPSRGAVRYRRLHENVIAGPEPFSQMAIEYEIEMLSVKFGPRVLEQCARVLGGTVLDNLSFLTEHVELDVGHTRFNAATLNQLLAAHPQYLAPLVAAGCEALAAYADFLEDCWQAPCTGPQPDGARRVGCTQCQQWTGSGVVAGADTVAWRAGRRLAPQPAGAERPGPRRDCLQRYLPRADRAGGAPAGPVPMTRSRHASGRWPYCSLAG